MGSTGERHEPAGRVAHNLVNTLSAIIGHCDLLNEKIERHRGRKAARRCSRLGRVSSQTIH
jgi:hypothetical protein